MKKRITTFFLILFVTLFSFSACDSDDGVSSGSLAGTYVLNYMMDKLEGITIYAGQATDFGNGTTMTLSQNLTLTESTYTMVMTVVISLFGEDETETMTENGTYTISGNTMTATQSPADGGETTIFTYSMSGNQLTLEDDESKMVYDKR